MGHKQHNVHLGVNGPLLHCEVVSAGVSSLVLMRTWSRHDQFTHY